MAGDSDDVRTAKEPGAAAGMLELTMASAKGILLGAFVGAVRRFDGAQTTEHPPGTMVLRLLSRSF